MRWRLKKMPNTELLTSTCMYTHVTIHEPLHTHTYTHIRTIRMITDIPKIKNGNTGMLGSVEK